MRNGPNTANDRESVLLKPVWPRLWLPVIAAAGTGLGLGGLLSGQLGALGLLLPFGAFLALSVWWLWTRPDRLTVDRNGLSVSTFALGRYRLLRSDIRRFAVIREERGRSWIHIDVRAEATAPWPWRRKLPGPKPAAVSRLPFIGRMDVDELAALLEEWRRGHVVAAGHDQPDLGVADGPTAGDVALRQDWHELRAENNAAAGASCVTALFAVLVLAAIPLFIVWSRLQHYWWMAAALLILLLFAPATIRAVLLAVGPRPRLQASVPEARQAETFQIRWQTTGRFREAASASITWEGREVAVERAYNPKFHRSVFAVRAVTPVVGPASGTASMLVPAESMHSFESTNAKISWTLRVRLDTPRWPRVEEEFVIWVRPAAVAAQ